MPLEHAQAHIYAEDFGKDIVCQTLTNDPVTG